MIDTLGVHFFSSDWSRTRERDPVQAGGGGALHTPGSTSPGHLSGAVPDQIIKRITVEAKSQPPGKNKIIHHTIEIFQTTMIEDGQQSWHENFREPEYFSTKIHEAKIDE